MNFLFVCLLSSLVHFSFAAPTPAPPPAPTPAPTWPAHMFVPKIVRHDPWYLAYTNAPTPAGPVDYDLPISTSEVYVPARLGKTVFPFCIGYGALCNPSYNEYWFKWNLIGYKLFCCNHEVFLLLSASSRKKEFTLWLCLSNQTLNYLYNFYVVFVIAL